MTDDSRMPELLAPAGSWEALRAAVAAGADAVYLAGRRFGARRYAANFDDEEIARAIDFCHARGVAVYVTVNTLIHDDELAEAAATLIRLYAAGADAVLVQDAGLAAVARRVVPGLVLHASTQMTVHHAGGARWAGDIGFSRVVLARELPIEEIREIARELGAGGPGLEIFVHGALCYCYSGQCLFSSIVGGRSGNRGMCAQPCRKPYALVAGGTDEYGRPSRLRRIRTTGDYLLSPRDLSVYPHLDRVVRAPVASLKIEGRMRSPEYVATVTGVYRRALDAIAAGQWRPDPGELRDLMLAFNRDFTAGYLLGDRGAALMGPERPDNRGVVVGRVISFDPRQSEAEIRLSGDLVPSPGDGIAVRPPAGGEEAVGAVVRTTRRIAPGTIAIRVPAPVGTGWEVAVTRRAGLADRLPRTPETPPLRPLLLDLTVRWENGIPVLSGTAPGKGGRAVAVEVRADSPMEPARTRPLEEGEITAQLAKTGGTPFAIGRIALDYPGGLFAPPRQLNRLRRDFFARAEQQIALSYRPSPGEVAAARERCTAYGASLSAETGTPATGGSGPVLVAYADSHGAVRGAVAGGCRRICFEAPIPRPGDGEDPARSVLGAIGEASRICRSAGAELVWKWPRITRSRFLDSALPLLAAVEPMVAGVMVGHAGTADVVRRRHPGISLFGSAAFNVFNHETALALGATFTSLTLSQELAKGRIEELVRRVRARGDGPGLEVIVQGPVELMVSEDCLLFTHLGRHACGDGADAPRFWGIRDGAGRVFPFRLDGECRTHIFNCVETCLVDQIPLLASLGLAGLAIDARGRTGRYAEEMAGIYTQALAAARDPPRDTDRLLKGLTQQAKERSIGGITAAHFHRGVRDDDDPGGKK